MLSLWLTLTLSTGGGLPFGWDDGCPKRFVAVGEGACLAAPATFEPGHLIVYFHGMVPNARSAYPEVALLADEATSRGFAVLALEGEEGLCNWGKAVASHRCWPTDKTQLPEAGTTLGRFERALAGVTNRLKRAPGPPFVAGFSNGGFFTTLLASETTMDAAAYIVMHAGGVTGNTWPERRRRPMLLMMATDDTVQFPTMRDLAETLRAARWSPRVVTRDGLHELRRDDVKALVDFCEGELRSR